MKYISTRGQMEPIEFQDAVMTGLAPDGGLLLPESLPNIGNKLEAWSKLSYTELAFEVISLFATDVPANDLKKLINDSYATFEHPEVCPSVEVGDFQIFIGCLLHGV